MPQAAGKKIENKKALAGFFPPVITITVQWCGANLE